MSLVVLDKENVWRVYMDKVKEEKGVKLCQSGKRFRFYSGCDENLLECSWQDAVKEETIAEFSRHC
jgi:hypothetical protein